LWYLVGIPPDITGKINPFNFTFQKSGPVVCGGEIQELVDFHMIPVKNCRFYRRLLGRFLNIWEPWLYFTTGDFHIIWEPFYAPLITSLITSSYFKPFLMTAQDWSQAGVGV
jgi:hypothetical protein